MSKEDLMKMTVDALRKHASTLGIKSIRKYKKEELVNEIVSVEESNTTSVEEQTEAVSKESDNVAAKAVVIDLERKAEYIDSAEIGAIVAFYSKSGKVKSAKIIKRSKLKKLLMVETAYGASEVIKYEKVIWVRSGRMWPRGIYELFKGRPVNGNGK